MELEHEVERGYRTISLKVSYDVIQHYGEPGTLSDWRGPEIDIWSILDCDGNEVEVTPAEYDEIKNRAIKAIL